MSSVALPRYRDWARTLGGLLLPRKRRPALHRLSGFYPAGTIPAGIDIEEGRLGETLNCPPGCCGGTDPVGCCGLCEHLKGTPIDFDLPISGFGGNASGFNGNWVLSQQEDQTVNEEFKWCKWVRTGSGFPIIIMKPALTPTNSSFGLTAQLSNGCQISYGPCTNMANCYANPWIFERGSICIGGTGPANISLFARPLSNPKKCGWCCSTHGNYPSAITMVFRDWVTSFGNDFSCLNGWEVTLPLIPPFGGNDPPFGFCHHPQYGVEGIPTPCPFWSCDYLFLSCTGAPPNTIFPPGQSNNLFGGFEIGMLLRVASNVFCFGSSAGNNSVIDCSSFIGTANVGLGDGFFGICQGTSTQSGGWIDFSP